jgi:hypothetical protein
MFRKLGFVYFWLVLWITLLPSTCMAQLNATTFEDYSQLEINPYLLNPAAVNTTYNYNLRSQYIIETGLIKNVNRFYFDADFKIKTTKENSFHFLGIQTTGSNLGDYIHKNRLNGRYSWYSRISENAYLSSGIALGFVNYALLTTQGGTGGSDFGPDGMVGIQYIRHYLSAGLAIQQLFSPVLTPIRESFQQSRLYIFNMSEKFEITPNTTLTLSGNLQYSNSQPLLYNMGLTANISNIIFSINNVSLRKTSISFGVKNIAVLKNKLMIYYTYSIYQSSFPLPNNSMEFFIAFQK